MREGGLGRGWMLPGPLKETCNGRMEHLSLFSGANTEAGEHWFNQKCYFTSPFIMLFLGVKIALTLCFYTDFFFPVYLS